MKDLGFSADTSTPHRPQTNGIAERAVRRVKEGTSCTLNQSGLNEDWWGEAMLCFCFLRNIRDLLVVQGETEIKTAYKHRFGQDFRGPMIPFGAQIKYKPITDQDIARLHSFGDKLLPGIFSRI